MPRIDWPVTLLLALSVALRLGLAARGWPVLDSDEATIGLMGKHILSVGELPIFFYGQHYMGPIEAYVAAGSFALLGVGTFALRVAMVALTTGFLACAYLLGRFAYGRAAGLLALAFLALGPVIGLLRELAGIGGYQETLLFGALIPLLVYAVIRPPSMEEGRWSWWRRGDRLPLYTVLGLVIGLGVWSDELILPFVVAPLCVLAVARWRAIRGRGGLALLAGIVIGGLPFIVYNLTHHLQSFTEATGRTLAPNGSVAAPAGTWPQQLLATLRVAVPTVYGDPHVCLDSGLPQRDFTSYPGSLLRIGTNATCDGSNLAFSALILGIFALVGWRALVALRGARHVGETPATNEDGVDRAALWLRVMLVGAALLTVAQYTLNRLDVGITEFDSVRYLLPLLITVPLLMGALWALARRGASGWSFGWRGARWRERGPRVAAAATLAALFAFALLGLRATVATASDGRVYALPTPPNDARILAELRRVSVTR
ncbi:MAG TPA: glycosyltransferase family 39 protein, partial [Ktedonobacterales bacterium]|nr:glycosyltransferase family 39 protein [Ktedonobacterales bacterium]